MHIEPGVPAAHSLRLVLAVTERATLTIAATVRAAGHADRLPVVRRSLLAARNIPVRIAVRQDVRRAIARALRRHRPVLARASITLLDRAGNRGSASRSGAITG